VGGKTGMAAPEAPGQGLSEFRIAQPKPEMCNWGRIEELCVQIRVQTSFFSPKMPESCRRRLMGRDRFLATC
jgi:hypothetical protein